MAARRFVFAHALRMAAHKQPLRNPVRQVKLDDGLLDCLVVAGGRTWPRSILGTTLGLPLAHCLPLLKQPPALLIRRAPSNGLDLAPVSALARAIGRVATLAQDALKPALLGHPQ